jgi:hypothetical protein
VEHKSLSFRETYQFFRPCLCYDGIGEDQGDNAGTDQRIRERNCLPRLERGVDRFVAQPECRFGTPREREYQGQPRAARGTGLREECRQALCRAENRNAFCAVFECAAQLSGIGQRYAERCMRHQKGRRVLSALGYREQLFAQLLRGLQLAAEIMESPESKQRRHQLRAITLLSA